MSEAKTKTLLVRDAEGEFKVDLPANAKLTFGPNVPFARGDGHVTSQHGYALRVYVESKENIIAVFTNVRWFRDITLPVFRKVLKEAGKTLWRSDEQGFKVEREVKREESFEREVVKLTDGNDDTEQF